MEIEFRTEELEDLYSGEKVKNKEFKSNPNLIRSYIKTVKMIQAPPNLKILKQISSLNLEKLKNNPQGFSSVRIDGKYRLIIELVMNDSEEVEIVGIEEISNHYS